MSVLTTCPATLNFAPFDGETGRQAPPKLVRCIAESGHVGYHAGDDGMPFGPPVSPAPSEVTS